MLWVAMSSGWERIESDVWEGIVEVLPRPLTREQAMQDLRHLLYGAEVRGARDMSNTEIAVRWGWSSRTGKPAEARVRRLKASGDWEDPHKPKRRGDDARPTRDRRGDDVQKTDEPDESDSERRGDDAAVTRDRRANAPTRVLRHPSPSPSPSTLFLSGQADDPPTQQTDLHRVVEAYRRHWPRRLRGKKPKLYRGMVGCVERNGADDVIAVIDWVATSPHQRAQLLRDGGYTTETIFGSKFDSYLALAQSNAPQARPGPREQDLEVDRVWGIMFACRDNPQMLRHQLNGSFERMSRAVRACSWSWGEFRHKTDKTYIKAAWKEEFARHYTEGGRNERDR